MQTVEELRVDGETIALTKQIVPSLSNEQIADRLDRIARRPFGSPDLVRRLDNEFLGEASKRLRGL